MNNCKYLTLSGYETLCLAAQYRKQEDLNKSTKDLTEKLVEAIKEATAKEYTGQEFIIYCAERKIGKTTAVILAASLTDTPIYSTQSFKKFLMMEAQKIGVSEKIKIYTLADFSRGKLDGRRITNILIDQTEDLEQIKRDLPHYGHVPNIIGIQ